MADNTTTGAVTSSIRPQARPTPVSGIGAKTPARQEEKAEMSFMDRIANLFTGFGGKDPNEKPASVNTYNAKISVYQDMEEEARTSAELARQDRQGLGITRSLTGQEWAQTFGKEKALEPSVTQPFWYQGLENPKALAPAPVEITPIPTQSRSAGLMAPPAAGQLPAVDTTTPEQANTTGQTTNSNTFSSITNNLYDAFTEGGQEGTEAHVGLDAQNITLPAGIVANGLVYDGQTINAGGNTIPASSFDASLLDTSGAYKTIGTGDNAVTIRRSDYSTDQDFSKAVIAEFENRAKTSAGDRWDNIPQGAQEAIVKIGWNIGDSWYSGNTANVLYDELSSDTPNVSNINSNILKGSTVIGGGASIGVAKARADAYNAAREAFDGSEITRITADNTGTKTAFNYYDAAGTLIHTEQTSRAVGLYENSITEVSKNAAGVW